MKIVATFFFVSLSVIGYSQSIKEINWINNTQFEEKLADFPQDSAKDVIVIYANELNTGKLEKVIKLESGKNTLKNIYIFANKIIFDRTLDLTLNGILDTSEDTKKRDGGKLFIYANTAIFVNTQVLRIDTNGAYIYESRHLQVAHLVDDNWLGVALEDTDSKVLKTLKGGAGGEVILVFENLVFNEADLIERFIKGQQEAMEITHEFDREPTETKEQKKAKYLQLMEDVRTFFPREYQETFKDQIELNFATLAKQMEEIESINDLNEYHQAYKKRMLDFFFDFNLTYIKGSLTYSRNFNDLNNGHQSKFKKLFISESVYPDRIYPFTSNIYVDFYSSAGNDIITSGPEDIRYLNTYGSTGTFHYYNDFITCLKANKQYENFAARWIILILKDIKLKIQQSIKKSDYPAFVEHIKHYNALPDILFSDEKSIDKYSALLKEINALKETFKDRIIPIKDNVIQIIENNKVNYYTLPAFSYVKPFYVNSDQKLATIKADVAANTIQLNLELKLAALFSDESIAKNENLKKVQYMGMYNDWGIESFAISNEGIAEGQSYVEKNGETLKVKLVIKDENKITFALLFGNGNFFITLNCYSNKDRSFKFQINLPVNFRYRSDASTKLVSQQKIINIGSNDIVLHGFEDSSGKIALIEPATIKPSEEFQLEQAASSIPAELVENVMESTLLRNYHYFNDLTSEKNLMREITIKNNFPNRTEDGNYFQNMLIHITYSDGKTEKTIDVDFRRPGESRFIRIGLPLDSPKFVITGELNYDNEILKFGPKSFNSWNIILDGSSIKF
jgi:hypothetical protein